LQVQVTGGPADGSRFVLMQYGSSQGDFSSIVVESDSTDECAAQGKVEKGLTNLAVVFAAPVGCTSSSTGGPQGPITTGILAGIIIGGVVVLAAITAAIVFGNKTIRKKLMPWRYRG